MKSFRVSALRSGSSGNLHLIEHGESRFVVDCGVNGKQFAIALQEADIFEDEIKDIQGIVITHEHSDHICGLGVVLRRYKIPVYISEKTWYETKPKLGRVDENLVRFISDEKPFQINDLEIMPFSIYHDAVDPLGFTIKDGQAKVAFCTDTGMVDERILAHLSGSKVVFMETNYEPNLLDAGSYPWHLKKRIKSEKGHLSNQAGATVCRTLLEQGSECFVLSHLSQENNFPKIAEMVAEEIINGEDACAGDDYTLQVANRYKKSESIAL